MRRVSVRRAVLIAVAALMMQFVARSAQAAPVTYVYTGQLFDFCGYGCGNEPGDPDNEPADWASDHIIASLTFDAPLAPNLTFADDVFSLLTGWTMMDALGYLSLSSAAGDQLTGFDDGVPALVLSTDATGNIVDYVMATYSGGHIVGIINPPVFCGECGDNGHDVASFLTPNYLTDTEWDAASSLPGSWQRRTDPQSVPESATFLLLGLGSAVAIAARHRNRQRATLS